MLLPDSTPAVMASANYLYQASSSSSIASRAALLLPLLLLGNTPHDKNLDAIS